MTTGNTYWAPICELATRLRCWSRAAVNDGLNRWTTDWGQLLILPVSGYLEVTGGPYRIRQFDWVQLPMRTLRGGLGGRPLEFVDLSHELLTGVKKTFRDFELRDESWSVSDLFDNEPIKVIHFPNPFCETT
jgi:hypothetical protein